MARANHDLIDALRRTATRLSGHVSYQWGHTGMCNCGLLAQSITARNDIRCLEKLSDPDVIRRVGRHLRFNNRDEVALYMLTWAELLVPECAYASF